jgi:hypothetical protein
MALDSRIKFENWLETFWLKKLQRNEHFVATWAESLTGFAALDRADSVFGIAKGRDGRESLCTIALCIVEVSTDCGVRVGGNKIDNEDLGLTSRTRFAPILILPDCLPSNEGCLLHTNMFQIVFEKRSLLALAFSSCARRTVFSIERWPMPSNYHP